jgi:hypothetical protein
MEKDAFEAGLIEIVRSHSSYGPAGHDAATEAFRELASPDHIFGHNTGLSPDDYVWLMSALVREHDNVEGEKFYDVEGVDGTYLWPWFMAFVKHFLREIRNHLCDQRKLRTLPDASRATPAAICAGLGAYLSSTLNIKEPVAIGLAAAALYIVVRSTHGAFCRMTDEETLEKLYKPTKETLH